MKEFDSRALGIWLLSSIFVAFLLNHPVTDLLIIGSAAIVGASSTRSFRIRPLLILGMTVMLVRTALFALTGHAGEHLAFHVPRFTLPLLFSQLELGGPVMWETLLQGFAEGLRLLVVLVCIGAFLAHVRTIDLLRMVPRFLFDVALVLNIALTFAPQVLRKMREVREAQTMRGGGNGRLIHPSRYFTPVVTSAIERSIALAESMESRGFGTNLGESRFEARWRLFAVGAMGATLVSTLVLLAEPSVLAGLATAASAMVVVYTMRELSLLTRRYRYTRSSLDRADLLIILASLCAFLLAVVFRSPMWDPYRELLPAAPTLGQIIAATASCAPAALRSPRRVSLA